MIKELKSYQRSFLTKKAHSLKPVVMLGKNGISQQLIQAVMESLAEHELIKLKFVAFKEKKTDILQEITAQTGALLARVIGNIAILYKEHEDPEKRKIHIPGSH